MHGYDSCTDSGRPWKKNWITDIQKRRTSISGISTHSIRSRSSSSTLGLKYTSFQHFPSVPIGFCTDHPEPTGTKSCEVVLSPFPCRVASVCLFSWSWGISILFVLAVLRAQRCLVQCLVLLSCLTQKQSFDSSSPVFRSLYVLPLSVPPDPKNNHSFMKSLYYIAQVLITLKHQCLLKKDAEVVENILRSTIKSSEALRRLTRSLLCVQCSFTNFWQLNSQLFDSWSSPRRGFLCPPSSCGELVNAFARPTWKILASPQNTCLIMSDVNIVWPI